MTGVRMPDDPVQRTAIYSLLLNIFLVGAKLVLSELSGSLSLRADAIHSMVDVLASLALIVGLVISTRKSENFPYGLYKVENVVSVAISILLFLSAYEIVMAALRGEQIFLTYSGWQLLAVMALVPIPFIFGRYQIRIGERFGSPSMIADGAQHQADVLTSSIVLIAFLGQMAGVQLDRVAAVVIALFVIRAGWDILESGMRVLLDASVDRETLERIRSIIEEAPEVVSVKEVVARNSGRYLFVEANLVFRLRDLQRAHASATRIEESIKREVPAVDRIIIHYEPMARSFVRYAVPLADPAGDVGTHFGESPYFAILDIDNVERKVKRQEIVANPYLGLEKGKGIKVAELLLKHKPDIVLTKESLRGRGPGYAFAEAGVETLQIQTDSLKELIDDLLRGQQLA
ncbi:MULTISPECIES: cation diffusion facilitator family transporter [Methanothrix]|jgi:cation diffusion facilitator family transporter|uniref:Cation diffusion facilitator family transporter n=2 Tax=Methanothrix TaxID=2222 RepID=A0B6N4_METTP|nr:cation diffusion facilitator family transporter [Methanothrix thermoacetophila]ABK14358.1 cation diffusion facilitator family transporter [Methanothrix thermoacetophila PT]